MKNIGNSFVGLSARVLRTIATLAIAASVLQAPASPMDLVPAPRSMTVGEGFFLMDCSRPVSLAAEFELKRSLPGEAYELSVTVTGITVRASSAAGRFYAVKTLEQLAERAGPTNLFRCVEISDSPRYRYRGLMIDEARRFFGKVEIKRQLEMMSRFKMNVLHWHLTDDQGWRIEIKKYPKLTKKGSVRPASPEYGDFGYWDAEKGERVFKTDSVKYGPYYYTQDDIREIVDYARRRFITIVPEIEIPGHSSAAIAAYPELSCPGCKTLTPLARWGVERYVFCAANPEAFRFLEGVLDEVIELFPGPFIHIGGDECQRGGWKDCPKCQKMISDEGLSSEKDLQAKFTRHFTRYLADKGRRAVGWDEVVGVEIPTNTAVMSWRTKRHFKRHPEMKFGWQIASNGFDVIMSPNDYCYLDYDQELDDDPYVYPHRKLPLERVYCFDPSAGVPPEALGHVLGGQGNAWSEHIRECFELEWKIWPRAAALAEVLWTAPRERDFEDFKRRMKIRRKEMIEGHFNCAPVQ